MKGTECERKKGLPTGEVRMTSAAILNRVYSMRTASSLKLNMHLEMICRELDN